ncbi:amino acid ABC transporter permease [Yinghuangia aomiensis]|uniref:Amino acid ABC transporter permease n=1 Tax=Yinghuangia aomiensis TaxID=676205 RepID=A0ABP9GLH2_9ACTN
MAPSFDKGSAGGPPAEPGPQVPVAPGAGPVPIKAIPVPHYGRWIAAVAVIAVLALIGIAFSNADINYGVIPDYLFSDAILEGVKNTVVITVLSMVLGLVLGVMFAVMRLSENPVTSTVAWLYIWFFRGTPVLVQLLLWYNLALIFPTFDIGFYSEPMTELMTPFLAALLGLGINEGAYMAEIVRAGIQSVDEGQTEASQALGMSGSLTMRRIVLPQAMRVIIPPTGNEFINMLKTSSLASVITYEEVMRKSQDIYSRNLATMELLFVASIWYLFLTSVFSVGQYYLERHYAKGSQRELPPTVFRKIRATVFSVRRPAVQR